MTKRQLFDLTGRTALVTGSSGGLGLAIARGLAEAGAAIVLEPCTDQPVQQWQSMAATSGFANFRNQLKISVLSDSVIAPEVLILR